MSELDLAQTENAVPHHPPSLLGLEESKDSSMVSNMSNLSYEDGEEEEGEEQEEEVVEAAGGEAAAAGSEGAEAAEGMTPAPKKKRRRRRKRRVAARRFGPPHLDDAQIKRSKVRSFVFGSVWVGSRRGGREG